MYDGYNNPGWPNPFALVLGAIIVTPVPVIIVIIVLITQGELHLARDIPNLKDSMENSLNSLNSLYR